MTTHVLNFKLELSLGPLVGSLEGQMLKEVSSSIGLIGFSTRSGIDVNTDGASGSVGVVFGSDGKAVRQLCDAAVSKQSIFNGERRIDSTYSSRLCP